MHDAAKSHHLSGKSRAYPSIEALGVTGSVMPSFHYRAYDARGNLAEGDIEARSEAHANDQLWGQGLTPFQVQRAASHTVPWWRRELLPQGKPSLSELAAFTRELATLNSAKVPIDDALRILSDQATSRSVGALAHELLSQVLDGSTLSDAMRKHDGAFSADYLSMVRAGELSGTLGQVLQELASLLERRVEIRDRIRSALFYPCFLILLCIASIAIIVSVLVPSIAPVFAQSNKPVPDMLQFLMLIHSNGIELVAATSAIAFALGLSCRAALKRPATRIAYDRAKLAVPFFGTLTLHQETARFARTLGTLLKADVPLLQATGSACDVIRNRHLSSGIERAISAIRNGSALHRALRVDTSFPPTALRMISIGEDSGTLDEMLLRVAAMFEQRTQQSTDQFMKILTPMVTLVIGGLIGSIIISVMSAVLSLNDLAIQ